MNCSSPLAKLALEIALRTVAAKTVKIPLALFDIHPQAKFQRGMTKNCVTVRSIPLNERIVHLNKLFIAQSQNPNQGHPGTKSRAKALFTLAQPCLALAQEMFRACSIRFFQRERYRRCERRNKVNFLRRPMPSGPDMFVTKHAGYLSAQPDRHGEQGGNAMLLEVIFRQAARGRMLQDAVGHDGSFGGQSRKIGRTIGEAEAGAFEL